MTPFQKIQIVYMVLSTMAICALFLFRTGATTGERRVNLAMKIEAIEGTIEKANKKMSERGSRMIEAIGRAEAVYHDLQFLQREHEKAAEWYSTVRERLARLEERHWNGEQG